MPPPRQIYRPAGDFKGFQVIVTYGNFESFAMAREFRNACHYTDEGELDPNVVHSDVKGYK